MHKRLGLTALTTLATLGLMAANAAQAADAAPGFYAGVSIGNASAEDDDSGFDGDDTGFKLFGGYSFNQNFAVELAYFNGGAPDDNFGSINVELETTGFIGSAVGRLPVSDTVTLFGKIGFASYDVEATARSGGSALRRTTATPTWRTASAPRSPLPSSSKCGSSGKRSTCRTARSASCRSAVCIASDRNRR
ncbi:MAG: porin family protein [Gammaproteobacteria bacterium]|nr:porin family protein [Gammaproteobacteria bacterium]